MPQDLNGNNGLAALVNSLDRLESTVSRAAQAPWGSGRNEYGLKSQFLPIPGDMPKESPGGPLGVFSSIGSSWRGSGAMSAALWARSIVTEQMTQGIMRDTAGAVSNYDPSAGAARYAAAYRPLASLEFGAKLVGLGGVLDAWQDGQREPLNRGAQRIGMAQEEYWAGRQQLNSQSMQIASSTISLNRQYTPQQQAYNQELLNIQQQYVIPTKQFDTNLADKFKRAKYKQGMYETERDTYEASSGFDWQAGIRRDKALEEYRSAQAEYDTTLAGKDANEAMKAGATKQREQALERYFQAVKGAYSPGETSNWTNTATAPSIGAPTEDPAIGALTQSNDKLDKIAALLGNAPWNKGTP